ncbi:MAG: TVP38/TMEM64 family protein [Alphaproteobacteria bacterium]
MADAPPGPPGPPGPPPQRWRWWLTAAGLVIFVLIAVGGFLLDEALLDDLKALLVRLQAHRDDWGFWAILAAVALLVLHTLIPFPIEVLAIANGMLWGTVTGTLITWSGAMLGAVLAFAISRRFGRPLVRRMVPQRHWAAMDRLAASEGVGALFLARFIPVISFNLVNYAAGLTAMRWWTFIWVTAIGILPLTVAMVAMGGEANHLEWPFWVGGGAVVVTVWVLWKLIRRRKRPAQPN